MSLSIATPAADGVAATGTHPVPGVELAALAYALPHALAPDRDRPARWLSTPFVVTVEQARARLAPLRDVDALAEAFDHHAGTTSRPATTFADALALLARDATRIAAAIRHLEITDGTSLASWPELVRGGIARPSHPRTANDASLWFG
jgi:hypothetical protein